MAVVNFVSSRYFNNSGGINEKVSDALIPDTEARQVQNLILRKTGKLVERPGFEKFVDISTSDTTDMRAIYQHISETDNKLLVITSQDSWTSPFSLFSSSTAMSPVSFSTISHTRFGGYTSDTLSTSAYPSITSANNNTYVANGHRVYSFDGDKYSSFGIYPPEQALSNSGTAAAGEVSTSKYYAYAYTLSNSITGYESNPLDTTDKFVNGSLFSSSFTSVSLVFNSVSIYDPKVDSINLYRTFGAASVAELSNRYFFLDTTPSSNPGYLDIKADTELGIEMDYDNYPFAEFNGDGLLKRDADDQITPKVVLFHQNRMWLANGKDSILRFSSFGRPESTSPLYTININSAKSDRQKITTLATLFDELVIFRDRSLYVLTGSSPSDIVVRKVSDDFGCIAPRTVKQVGNLLLFYSSQGWAAYTSGGIVDRISDNLEDTVSNIANPDDMQSALYFDDKMYWTTTVVTSSFVIEADDGSNYTVGAAITGELLTYPGGFSPVKITLYSPNGDTWELRINSIGTPYLISGAGTIDAPLLEDANTAKWLMSASPSGEIVTTENTAADVSSTIVVYDYANNSWIKMATSNSSVNNKVFGELRDSDGRSTVAVAGPGKIYKYNRNSEDQDDGTNVTSEFTTKFYDVGEPNFLKIFRHLQIEFDRSNEDYTVQVDCMYDYSDAVIHSYTRTITAGSGMQQERFGLNGNAYSFSFKMTLTSEDAKPGVLGWTIYSKLRSVRT